MAAPFSSPPRYVTPPRRALGPATPTLEETPTSTHTGNVVCSSTYGNRSLETPWGYPAQETLKDLGHTHIRDNSAATAGARIPRAKEGSRAGVCREAGRVPLCRERAQRGPAAVKPHTGHAVQLLSGNALDKQTRGDRRQASSCRGWVRQRLHQEHRHDARHVTQTTIARGEPPSCTLPRQEA